MMGLILLMTLYDLFKPCFECKKKKNNNKTAIEPTESGPVEEEKVEDENSVKLESVQEENSDKPLRVHDTAMNQEVAPRDYPKVQNYERVKKRKTTVIRQ